MRFTIFLAVWGLTAPPLFSQSNINLLTLFKKQNDTTLHTKKGGVLLVPLLYYTPDTRFAAGAMGVYYFHTGKEREKTRLSYVKLLADYTQNKQLDVWNSWNIFTNQEKYYFKGELRYRNFPDRFYGIGNNTPKQTEERLVYDLFAVKFLAMRRWTHKFFAGLDVNFENEYNLKLSPDGALAAGNTVGFNGGLAIGPGLVLLYDSRDNIINPSRGLMCELSSYFNSRWFGSTFEYERVSAEANYYTPIGAKSVLAFNTVCTLSYGDVPFLDMPRVGGNQILRGYAAYRYRDRHMAATQAEYRFPVYKRLGMVAFAGMGDVFSTQVPVQLQNLKYSIGTGLRFMTDTSEKLNIRIDFAVGRQSTGFYILLTEAF